MTRRLAQGIGCFFEMDIKNAADGLECQVVNISGIVGTKEMEIYLKGYTDALNGIRNIFGVPVEKKENTHDSRSRYLIEPRRY